MRALAITALASLLLVACSDNRTTNIASDAAADQGKTLPDGPATDVSQPKPDAGVPKDSFIMPDFDPGAPTFDFVFDRLLVPDKGDEYGKDLDGDGKVDNALGALLGTVASMMGGGASLQDTIDESVYGGDALMLMRLYADDFSNDPTVPGDLWYAEAVACCADPSDIAACRTEADTTCFSGTSSFNAVPPATKLGGKITASKMAIGVPELALPLPMVGGVGMSVVLSHVQVSGDLSDTGIQNGIIAGVIAQDEIQGKILPAVQIALNDSYQGGTAELGPLFDTDNDGTITLDEVINNALIKTFFGGDVDLDGDGVMELSLGMGFTAVNATIVAP